MKVYKPRVYKRQLTVFTRGAAEVSDINYNTTTRLTTLHHHTTQFDVENDECRNWRHLFQRAVPFGTTLTPTIIFPAGEEGGGEEGFR